jgi:hypothetical protein
VTARPGADANLASRSRTGNNQFREDVWLIYAVCGAVTIGLVVSVVLAFTSVSGQ